MQKIAIHYSYGGFSLPDEIKQELYLRGVDLPDEDTDWPDYDYLPRDHPILIQTLCDMPEIAIEAKIVVVEIPDDVEWKIQEYDGAEWVAEKHRTWSLRNMTEVFRKSWEN